MKQRFFLIFLLLPFLGWGQGFEAIFGSTDSDYGQEIVQLPDEGAYLVIYARAPSQSNGTGIGITKVDSLGNIVWQKYDDLIIQDQLDAYGFAVESDGFRIAVSNYDASINNFKVRMKKFNFDGEVVSTVEYELPSYSLGGKLRILPDLSMLVIVEHGFNTIETKICKLSPDGNLIWEKNFLEDEYYTESFNFFNTLPDGSFMTVTSSLTTLNGSLVTKFSPVGEFEWQTELPNIDQGYNSYIVPFPNGDGYCLWGKNPNVPFDVIAVKLGNDGQVVWNKSLDPYIEEVRKYGVVPGNSNSLYIAGIVFNNGIQIKLLELDGNGDVILEKQFTQPNITHQKVQLTKTGDDALLITAEYNTGFWESAPYAFKTDLNGEMLWSWSGELVNKFSIARTLLAEDGGYLLLGYFTETVNNVVPTDNRLIKFSANGVVYPHQVIGKLTFDENLNCGYDTGEQSLAGWKIKGVTNQARYATTKADGSFRLYSSLDSIVLNALPPNDSWASCPDPLVVIFNNMDSVNATLNAQAAKDCPVLEVDASAQTLRRCFDDNIYHISCLNTGTVAFENLQITVLLDSFFIFQNASLPLASQNGQELVFNIGSLGLLERISFTIQVEVSCNAALGQEHCVTVTATADNTCPDVDNSLAQTLECQPNSGAYDPNDKRAFSEGRLTERFITADSLIEYQIRFQNTGTDTAFTVVIADTLSSLLDIESIRPGASSHAYRMELEQNNILRFVFNDIMLPDSNVNEPASNGFVKFRIQHQPGLVPGDVIPNKAAIYFDFNEAVITNNLELEIKPILISDPDPDFKPRLLVYPQPANGSFWVEPTGVIGPWSASIHDVYGRAIRVLQSNTPRAKVEGLAKGFYFMLVKQGGNLYTAKVVVE